jgi:uncharacterized alkaline shock family protein YloU
VTATEQRSDQDAGPERDEAAGQPTSDPPSAEDRGSLEVHPTVVRKVAERAADSTPGAVKAPRKIAGIGAGEQGASAKIGGFGGEVDVTLDVALHYPSPVRELTDDMRRRVTDEVHRITGYRVRSVRITVSALLPKSRPSRVE